MMCDKSLKKLMIIIITEINACYERRNTIIFDD